MRGITLSVEASKFGHAAWDNGQVKILRISVALTMGISGQSVQMKGDPPVYTDNRLS